MASALHKHATVQPGNRIEVTAPELDEGEAVELFIVPTGAPVSGAARRAFLRLPVADRRRLLEQQAERMAEHYARDTQWRELEGGDIIEY